MTNIPDCDLWNCQTVDEIEALLEKSKIKGSRGLECSCPVSEYLVIALGIDTKTYSIWTTHRSITLKSEITGRVIWKKKFEKHDVLKQFVVLFDSRDLRFNTIRRNFWN